MLMVKLRGRPLAFFQCPGSSVLQFDIETPQDPSILTILIPSFTLDFHLHGVLRPGVSVSISRNDTSCWVEIRWIIITLWHTECGEDHMVHHWCNVLETNALLALPPCLTSISYRLWVVPYFTLLIQLPPSHLFSFFYKFAYISYPLFSLFAILLFVLHKVFI